MLLNNNTHCKFHSARRLRIRDRQSLYNEERRLGDQRGSDTLVVPLITSNDGLSIANTTISNLAYDLDNLLISIHWLELVVTRYARLI